MGHFIEEAENREKYFKESQTISSQVNAEICHKNDLLFQPIHKEFEKYIIRIANLNPESRKPVVEIGSTHLVNEINYEYFASSYRTIEKRYLLFLRKEKLYNVWRRLIFTLTSYEDIVKLVIYEKATSETNLQDIIKKKQKVLLYISKIDHECILYCFDYLGYRISQHELVRFFKQQGHLVDKL